VDINNGDVAKIDEINHAWQILPGKMADFGCRSKRDFTVKI
jgi:hypothetical protein